MNESYAREEICRIGRSLFERGYVHATAGNISLRLDNGILITLPMLALVFSIPRGLPGLTSTAGSKAAIGQAKP